MTHKLDVLSCEDVILLKLLAGRLIDRTDVTALIRINRTNLDDAYLSEWGRRLELAQQLEELRAADG